MQKAVSDGKAKNSRPDPTAVFRKYVNKGTEINEIANEVGVICHKPVEELYDAGHKRDIDRKIAIYLAKLHANATNYEIGVRFGISYSTVTKTAENVERMIKTDRKLNRKIQYILSKLYPEDLY